MKRTTLIALCVFLLAAATVAAAATTPVLKASSGRTFVIEGKFFKTDEQVVVRLVAGNTGQPQVRNARASIHGSFAVDFGRIPISHCLSVSVSAVGIAGSRAVYKTHQLPACMPE